MSVRSKLLVSAAVVGLLAAAVAAVVHSSFTSTARNTGNTFEAGSIALADDDAEQVLFDLHGLKPGTPIAPKCLTVSFASTGSLTSAVRLYGATTGALADDLDVTLTRGSFPDGKPAGNACTGFAADSADHAGKGAGVLFAGTLDAYPDSWAAGIADPRTTWHAGDAASYRIDVALADTDEAQGATATHAFAFEARTS